MMGGEWERGGPREDEGLSRGEDWETWMLV